MTDLNRALKTVRIQNFLSLHDVELPLKPLTILVGPNASGKSNVLEALKLLRSMIVNENPPPEDFIERRLWAGGAKQMSFDVEASIDNKMACYRMQLQPKTDNTLLSESLSINGVEVISIKEGRGEVRDEDGENQISYKSSKLALKSAGNYGHKPITNELSNFVGDWKFYDLSPSKIREKFLIIGNQVIMPVPKSLASNGGNLQPLLSSWYEREASQFEAVSSSLAKAFGTKLKLEMQKVNGEERNQLALIEAYSTPISLENASDGTLRLLAYQALMNQSELPSLIAIEEPERNFHPAWLNILSDLLGQLSTRTQVIITTHSSQLLDCFASEALQDNLSVLLLRNVPHHGTEVIPLDNLQREREGLKIWLNEFGIGSAIFDSELLQDIMGT